jgi:malate dehydrogenase
MKISVIGATGTVGSNVAFNLMAQRLADELVLIDDPRPDQVAVHANDMDTGATGTDMRVKAGTAADLKGSGIVIVAAGSANTVLSRMEVLPANLPIIKEIAGNIVKYCPGAIVITATNPVCPLNYAMYKCTGFNRERVIGYSYNDSIRFRMRVARELGVDSSQVEATVVGEHGNSQVLLFSSVRAGGEPVPFGQKTKAKLRQQVPDGQAILEDLRMKTGRTAGWTTAVGMAALCRAIEEDSGRMIPCSLVLDGEYGYRDLGMSVPALVGAGGIKQILEWKLAPDELDGLKRSAAVLKEADDVVREFLKKGK